MSTILAASTACQESRLGTNSGRGYYAPNVRVDGLLWNDVLSTLTPPTGLHLQGDAGISLSEDKTVYCTKLLLERAERDGETIR